MNYNRLIAASTLGLVFGFFCALATVVKYPSEYSMGVLASIIHNRILIGVLVGLAGRIDLRPFLRGSVVGGIVGLGIALPAGLPGGAVLLVFSVFYGALTDIAASRIT